MPGWLKNALVQGVLKKLLEGNTGSNLLTAALVPLLAARVDWVRAFQGDTLEILRALGVAGVGVLGYCVGKYPKVAKVLGIVEKGAEAIEAAVVEEQQAEGKGGKVAKVLGIVEKGAEAIEAAEEQQAEGKGGK